MKKVILGVLILAVFIPNVFAGENTKNYGKLCEDLGGQYLTGSSLAVQDICRVGQQSISLDSFQDKYNHYIGGMMIHYASEFKYSDAKKWKNYLEFFAQDNADLETFSHLKLDAKVEQKLSDDIKIQTDLYNFMFLQSTLGEKVTSQIEKILETYESKLSETEKQAFYKLFAQKVDAKVKEMENFQMTARFTQEGYKKFTFKLNVFKYMLSLVKGRME